MPKYKYKDFNDYWYNALTRHERGLLARLSGMTYGHLMRLARGGRMAGPKTVARLQKVDRRITARLLRPDLYGKRVFLPRKTSKGDVIRPGT